MINNRIAKAFLISSLGCLLFITLGCHAPPDPASRSDIVLPIEKNGVWGAIDVNGNSLVEPAYTNASYGFGTSLAGGAAQLTAQEGVLLMSADSWCYVSLKRIRTVSPQLDGAWRVYNLGESLFGIELHPEQRGYEFVPEWARWAAVEPALVYDPYNLWNPSLPGAVPTDRLSEGLLTIVVNQKFGYADRTGNVVISPEFDAALPFTDGLAAVMVDNDWGYIDKLGRQVIALQYKSAKPFEGGVALVTTDTESQPFLIDKRGDVVNTWAYSPNPIFSEGLAMARDETNTLKGYRDRAGNWHIGPRFKEAYRFSEGLAAVEAREAAESGYIDMSGNLKISIPKARTMSPFHHGRAWVEIYGPLRQAGYLDVAGKWVWKAK